MSLILTRVTMKNGNCENDEGTLTMNDDVWGAAAAGARPGLAEWCHISISIGICLCDFACSYHQGNKGLLSGRPDKTPGHIHIPCFTSPAYSMTFCIVWYGWMQVQQLVCALTTSY